MSTPNTLSNRQTLETKYNQSRSNILLVVAFTVINLILLVINSNTYFLFSAFIPYMLGDFGMMLCGMYPAEYYGEDFSSMEFFVPSVFAVFLAIALIIVALYLISWIFSKKNKVGWMIFALVIFVIDTVGMLAFVNLDVSWIIDIAFHAWVIISLALGINAGVKLKKLPADEKTDVIETEPLAEAQESLQDSTVIRTAATDVKARILLEAEELGHTIIYRRVKRVNELVVDGNVYDEIEALIEVAHTLKAQINEHIIEVGFDGKAYSFLKIDGQLVTRKLRLY